MAVSYVCVTDGENVIVGLRGRQAAWFCGGTAPRDTPRTQDTFRKYGGSCTAPVHGREQLFHIYKEPLDLGSPDIFAFPGGKREDTDISDIASAIREWNEEVGILGVITVDHHGEPLKVGDSSILSSRNIRRNDGYGDYNVVMITVAENEIMSIVANINHVLGTADGGAPSSRVDLRVKMMELANTAGIGRKVLGDAVQVQLANLLSDELHHVQAWPIDAALHYFDDPQRANKCSYFANALKTPPP